MPTFKKHLKRRLPSAKVCVRDPEFAASIVIDTEMP